MLRGKVKGDRWNEAHVGMARVGGEVMAIEGFVTQMLTVSDGG